MHAGDDPRQSEPELAAQRHALVARAHRGGDGEGGRDLRQGRRVEGDLRGIGLQRDVRALHRHNSVGRDRARPGRGETVHVGFCGLPMIVFGNVFP